MHSFDFDPQDYPTIAIDNTLSNIQDIARRAMEQVPPDYEGTAKLEVDECESLPESTDEKTGILCRPYNITLNDGSGRQVEVYGPDKNEDSTASVLMSAAYLGHNKGFYSDRSRDLTEATGITTTFVGPELSAHKAISDPESRVFLRTSHHANSELACIKYLQELGIVPVTPLILTGDSFGGAKSIMKLPYAEQYDQEIVYVDVIDPKLAIELPTDPISAVTIPLREGLAFGKALGKKAKEWIKNPKEITIDSPQDVLGYIATGLGLLTDKELGELSNRIPPDSPIYITLLEDSIVSKALDPVFSEMSHVCIDRQPGVHLNLADHVIQRNRIDRIVQVVTILKRYPGSTIDPNELKPLAA